MTRTDLSSWNLRDFVAELNSRVDGLEAVWLFGSRAYRTSSYRSDIDVLIRVGKPLPSADILHWLRDAYEPVDLFETSDDRSARSLVNGSTVHAEVGGLHAKLDAIELWTAAGGFSTTFDGWIQLTQRDVNFAMTLMQVPPDILALARRFTRMLEEAGYPSVFLGAGWAEISNGLADIVEAALEARGSMSDRASSFTPSALELKNEYDFQNLLFLLFQPWLRSAEREPFMIRFGGQTKSADIALHGGALVIEAKHVRSTSDAAAVTKTLEGLTSFYKQNPNVRALLFLILVDEGVSFDKWKVQAVYSKEDRAPIVTIRVVQNELTPRPKPVRRMSAAKPGSGSGA